jgi:hypothetical protein
MRAHLPRYCQHVSTGLLGIIRIFRCMACSIATMILFTESLTVQLAEPHNRVLSIAKRQRSSLCRMGMRRLSSHCRSDQKQTQVFWMRFLTLTIMSLSKVIRQPSTTMPSCRGLCSIAAPFTKSAKFPPATRELHQKLDLVLRISRPP